MQPTQLCRRAIRFEMMGDPDGNLWQRTVWRLAGLYGDQLGTTSGQSDIAAPRQSRRKQQSAEMAALRDEVRSLRSDLMSRSRFDAAIGSAVSGLETAVYPWLWASDIGARLAQVQLNRVIPLRIYLRQARPDTVSAISTAVTDVASVLGLEVAYEYPLVEASWFKRWFARTRDVATRPEIADRLMKLERAIELQGLQVPQAQVDLAQAEAATKLITAMPDDIPAAAQVGSLLVISVPGHALMTRTLTQQELITLETHQDLLTDPETTLKRLTELCTGKAPEGSSRVSLPKSFGELADDTDAPPRLTT